MANNYSGESGTTQSTFSVNGDGGDGYFIVRRGVNPSVFIRWDEANSNFKLCTDGINNSIIQSGTVGPTTGGTGQTSYVTGDMIYASGTNTLAKRTIGNTGDILTVAGGVPTWAASTALSQTSDQSREYSARIGVALGTIKATKYTAVTVNSNAYSVYDACMQMCYLGNGQIISPMNNIGDGKGYIQKSYDYGKNWKNIAVVSSGNNDMSGPTYLGNGNVLVFSISSGKVYLSTDYGETWAQQGSSTVFNSLTNAVTCGVDSSENQVIAAVYNSAVSISIDSGVTWTNKVSSPIVNNSIEYLGNGVILAGGGIAGNVNIWRSTDNGANWSMISAPFGVGYWNISNFVNCGNGIVLAFGGSDSTSGYSMSTDYGATWTGKTSPFYGRSWARNLYLGGGRIFAVCNNLGWKIHESYDYGLTWSVGATSPESNPFKGMCNLDDGSIVGIGNSGRLYRFSPTIADPVFTHSRANSLYIGTGTAADAYVFANNAETNKPYIKYNDTFDLWQLSNDGSANVSNINSVWTPMIPTTDFSTTSSDGYSVAMSTDQTTRFSPGQPVRVLDGYGWTGLDLNNQLYNYQNITGLSPRNLDIRGIMYFDVVSAGGPNYQVNIYKNSAKTQLIGHTNTYSGAGPSTLTITADNGSGLGGTFTALTPVVDTVLILFYTYHLLKVLSSTTMELMGPPLSTGSGNIKGIWVGNTSLLRTERLYIPGTYATAPSSSLLATLGKQYSVWTQGYASVVAFAVTSKTIDGGTAPIINLVVGNGNTCTDNSGNGITVDNNPGTWRFTGSNMSQKDCLLNPLQTNIEVKTTQDGAGGSADLSVIYIAVLEQ